MMLSAPHMLIFEDDAEDDDLRVERGNLETDVTLSMLISILQSLADRDVKYNFNSNIQSISFKFDAHRTADVYFSFFSASVIL